MSLKEAVTNDLTENINKFIKEVTSNNKGSTTDCLVSLIVQLQLQIEELKNPNLFDDIEPKDITLN